MTLRDEVSYLISLRQEGGYWDFKKQWHDKKTNLLHDIICMANNLHNRNAYIIIGVDEEDNFAIVDVKADPNRRNTQNMVTFLRDKKFAGGTRPFIHVEQICLSSKDIDVIVIENSSNTPFYLTDHFEGVRANHIYTRIMDTNTPIDKSADINNVEYLWRKRFHIDEMPIDRFRHFLKNPNDWETIQGLDMGYFYKYAPEYTLICESDDRNGYEYYIFGQVDTRPSWWMITLKYHQTALAQYLGLSLDGGRGFAIVPERDFALHNKISGIGYYIRDDLRYRILQFYHAKETADEYSYINHMAAVAIFQSKYEYEQFARYVKSNIARYEELYSKQGDDGLPYFPKLKDFNMEVFKKAYRDTLVIKKMLEEFRISDFHSEADQI